MSYPAPSGDTDVEIDADHDPLPPVRANESAPGTVVFSEDHNTDGWIATDLTVSVER
ncbi:hypothetical protein [Haloarchaeobius sp. DFWS5]|uniref:hypothetical protein n=1 Tax=Haloarchaeobius sp. DFWS5 TaxID=3446114 RepID=UPI003EBED0AF